jgi:hypothetical protein
MKGITAIAWVTLKAAFRFRLFYVLLFLLLLTVGALPLVIKHDGSAQGLIQITLTYTLGFVTVLLGFATLWIACGTLAKDIEDCQMQMIVVKPVSRAQIWLGKWLGIMGLNAVLLSLAGCSIYGMLHFRAKSLPLDQQAYLRDKVLVARGVSKLPIEDFQEEMDLAIEERIKETIRRDPEAALRMDMDFLRQQVTTEVRAFYEQVSPNGAGKGWPFQLTSDVDSIRDKTLFIRTKFNSAQLSDEGKVFNLVWGIGVPQTPEYVERPMDLTEDTYHEIPIPPNSFDDQGRLTITCFNMSETAILFPLNGGIEILYPKGGFAMNFVKGLLMILLWMGLFAAIGLMTAGALSFPVASFTALAILFIGLSSGVMSTAVEDGTIFGYNHEQGAPKARWIDYLVIPMFRFFLYLIQAVRVFSPIDSLSLGQEIPALQVGQAFLQVGVGLCGGLALVGIFLFQRRELATVQVVQ